MGRHMREVTLSEYLSFVKSRGYVVVAGERIDLWPIPVKRFEPLPDELGEIAGTVWSFPKRAVGPSTTAATGATGRRRYPAP